MTQFRKRSRPLSDKGPKRVLRAILIPIVAILLLGGACTAQDVSMGWCGVAPVEDKLVFCSVQGELIVADAATGSIKSRTPLENAVSGGLGCAPSTPAVVVYATPTISQGISYIAGSNGKLYMYNLESFLNRSTYLNADNPSPIIGGIAVYDNKLFVASSDGVIYALDSNTLEKKWQFSAQDKIWATPTVWSGKLYVGSFDHNLYALNLSDGSEEWRFSGANGAFVSKATIYDGTVYIGCLDRYFYAIDGNSGELIWKTENPAGNFFWSSALVTGEAIYAPNKDGSVYIYNRYSGELISKIDLGSAISSDPVIVGGKPIVITESGVLYSLDPPSEEKTVLANIGVGVTSPLVSSGEVIYIHTQEQEAVWAIEVSNGSELWKCSVSKQ